MNIRKIAQRNSSLDLIRIVAVFLVISVHFFLHAYSYDSAIGGYSGFYYLPVENIESLKHIAVAIRDGDVASMHGAMMFLMIVMRTLFSVCVPLFIILTGYLMSKKELTKGYYKGIRKTLIVFVLASLACMCFKAIHENNAAREAFYAFDLNTMFNAIHESGKYEIKNFILSIFDFSGANYSWYVEMYIGLFLIIPFLNLAYNKLKNKRQKQVLVATLVFLTILPSIVNAFSFETASWWQNPLEPDTKLQKLIPSFWMSSMYPLAYYFTGAYIREYGIKLKTRSMLPLFCITLFLFGLFNYWRSYGDKFQSGTYIFWYGIEPYVLSVMLFTMLSRIKSGGWHPAVKKGLSFVSNLTFGMYLLSFIFDELIYDILNKNVISLYDKLPYYFLTVPLCFICSLLASWLITSAAKGIIILYEKIKEYVKQQRLRKDKQKWQDTLFIALFAAIFVFSLWKCGYGFGGNDESFYLTIPRRLTMGDALFRDEWNLSQLSSYMLVPFVWLFRTIAGSTEGIILAARIFYVLIHGASSALIYTKLRKYGYISVFASAFFFLYTPFNIMALSYDSMGVGLVTLAGVLLATADYSKKWQIVFSGLAFAGAVLCCPYLAVVYAIFGLCAGIHYLLKKLIKKPLRFVLMSDMFRLRTFLFFTAGVGILAALFLLLTLPRVGISGIFENLPYMLEDPEHPPVAFWAKFGNYFKSIFEMHPHFQYAIYSYCAMALVMLIDRKRKLHRSVYLIITTAIVIYTYILLVPTLHSKTYNAIMFPLVFVGITSYVLCQNKPREIFAGLFMLGILYSFFVYYTSNQYFYIISMAFTAVNMASYVFLAQLIKEMRQYPDNIEYAVWIKRFSFVFVAVMILLQGAFQWGSKARHCFWDNDPKELTTEITEGPAAGIITTEYNVNTYNNILSDLRIYEDVDGERILLLTEKTWTYLAVDLPYGSYSAWLAGEKQSTIDRLKDFYELNPDLIPKYVYIPIDSKWDMTSLLTQMSEMGYTYDKTPFGYSLVRA